jgi:hypothetical protein
MPATLQRGLASQSISFANTLPNLSPPPKATCARSANTSNLPNVATSKGLMHQERQHLRSTQTSSLPLPHSKEANLTTNETQEIDNATSNERTHCVFMKPIAITGQIHSDQTGRFPITSSRGSKFIMVVYDYDSNDILSPNLSPLEPKVSFYEPTPSLTST